MMMTMMINVNVCYYNLTSLPNCCCCCSLPLLDDQLSAQTVAAAADYANLPSFSRGNKHARTIGASIHSIIEYYFHGFNNLGRGGGGEEVEEVR